MLPREDDSAWGAAEETAKQHRKDRLHRPTRRRKLDRLVGPVVAVIWLVSIAAGLIGLLTPGDHGYWFSFVSFGALVVFGVLGGWWLVSTGRYLVRGSPRSIRAAVPQSSRRSVARQLALREPLDRDHQMVVVEAAHQGKQLLLGQVAFYAFYVPLYLNIAHSSRGWVGPVFLMLGLIALLVGAVFLVVTYRRLSRLIAYGDREAPSDPSPAASDLRQP